MVVADFNGNVEDRSGRANSLSGTVSVLLYFEGDRFNFVAIARVGDAPSI